MSADDTVAVSGLHTRSKSERRPLTGMMRGSCVALGTKNVKLNELAMSAFIPPVQCGQSSAQSESRHIDEVIEAHGHTRAEKRTDRG